mmetsp:Transcript_25406/g.30799  ORF Transcript_25406/g.30799 Transcript_25406/m.30799 type:complete len:361 (-) Transcript_25406:82-1164(-)
MSQSNSAITIKDGEITVERSRIDTALLESHFTDEVDAALGDLTGFNSDYRAGLEDAATHVAETRKNLEKLERMKEIQEQLKAGNGFQNVQGSVFRQFQEWEEQQAQTQKARASKIGRLKKPEKKVEKNADKENKAKASEEPLNADSKPATEAENFNAEENIADMYNCYKELQELLPAEATEEGETWGSNRKEDADTDVAADVAEAGPEEIVTARSKSGSWAVTAAEDDEPKEMTMAEEDAMLRKQADEWSLAADATIEQMSAAPRYVKSEERVNEWDKQVYGFEWVDDELDMWEQGVDDLCNQQLMDMRAEMQSAPVTKPKKEKKEKKDKKEKKESKKRKREESDADSDESGSSSGSDSD